MEVLVLMIICSVSLATIFLFIFIYFVNQGQFDDIDEPAVRMLNDSIVNEKLV